MQANNRITLDEIRKQDRKKFTASIVLVMPTMKSVFVIEVICVVVVKQARRLQVGLAGQRIGIAPVVLLRW